MTLFTREIYSQEPEPFLTTGKLLVFLAIVGFVIVALHVVLWRAEMKMHNAEKAIKN